MGFLGCSGIREKICEQYANNMHSLQTDNHTNTLSLRPDALPDAQPTVCQSTKGNLAVKRSHNIPV